MTSRNVAPLPSRITSSSVPLAARYSIDPDHSVTAARAYRDTWDDFYTWKAEYNRLEMSELCVSSTEDRPVAKHDERDSEAADDDDWSSEHSYPSSYSPSELGIEPDRDDVQNLDSEMSFLAFEDSLKTVASQLSIDVYRHLPKDLADASENLRYDQSFKADSYQISIYSGFSQTSGEIDPDFLPHPRYFSCASISRNLPPSAVKPDSLSFSPFEDDLHFDHHRYLTIFPFFDWQSDFLDPDMEVIQLEVVRRLYHELGLSFSQINEFRILTKLRRNHESGLLWDASQRDLLWWPGAGLSEFPELHLSDLGTIPSDIDLFGHIRVASRTFCPNLNCIHTSCGIPRHLDHPPLKPINATLTSHQLQLSRGNPCGNHCFRHVDLSNSTIMEAVSLHNEEEIQTLKGVLEISPDILPCDLAAIVHIKCRDVFIYRTQLYANDAIEDNIIFEPTFIKPSWFFEDDPSPSYDKEGKANFSVLAPCHHKGACGRDSGCECFLKQHHCQRNCKCQSTCAIRWKGCSCSHEPGSRKKTCSTDECPCFATGRECDPEFCKACDARGRKSHKRPVCFNVYCQRAQYPHLYVGRGSWGLGAFTTQKILTNQAIGEYTGELLPLDSGMDTEQVSPIPYYTGLNYKFDLDSNYILDSMYMGNEMRYLNHKGPIKKEEVTNKTTETANCRGKIIYVNNCHRILFIANRRIEPDSELFIDYGLAYWTEKDEWAGAKEKMYWR